MAFDDNDWWRYTSRWSQHIPLWTQTVTTNSTGTPTADVDFVATERMIAAAALSKHIMAAPIMDHDMGLPVVRRRRPLRLIEIDDDARVHRSVRRVAVVPPLTSDEKVPRSTATRQTNCIDARRNAVRADAEYAAIRALYCRSHEATLDLRYGVSPALAAGGGGGASVSGGGLEGTSLFGSLLGGADWVSTGT